MLHFSLIFYHHIHQHVSWMCVHEYSFEVWYLVSSYGSFLRGILFFIPHKVLSTSIAFYFFLFFLRVPFYDENVTICMTLCSLSLIFDIVYKSLFKFFFIYIHMENSKIFRLRVTRKKPLLCSNIPMIVISIFDAFIFIDFSSPLSLHILFAC